MSLLLTFEIVFPPSTDDVVGLGGRAHFQDTVAVARFAIPRGRCATVVWAAIAFIFISTVAYLFAVCVVGVRACVGVHATVVWAAIAFIFISTVASLFAVCVVGVRARLGVHATVVWAAAASIAISSVAYLFAVCVVGVRARLGVHATVVWAAVASIAISSVAYLFAVCVVGVRARVGVHATVVWAAVALVIEVGGTEAALGAVVMFAQVRCEHAPVATNILQAVLCADLFANAQQQQERELKHITVAGMANPELEIAGSNSHSFVVQICVHAPRFEGVLLLHKVASLDVLVGLQGIGGSGAVLLRAICHGRDIA
jgi:hypothetical protein